MELLTIKAISQELGLAESSVRFYRDKFPHYIPSTGTGKGKRYLPVAVEVLRFIADMMRNGRTAEEVEKELSLLYEAVYDVKTAEPQNNITAAAAQQQDSNASLVVYQNRITDLQNHIADLQSTIDFLKDDLVYKDAILMKTQHQLDQALKPWWKRGRLF